MVHALAVEEFRLFISERATNEGRMKELSGNMIDGKCDGDDRVSTPVNMYYLLVIRLFSIAWW
jgi:hypothetical protein